MSNALRLPMPPSVNHLYPSGKNGRRFPSKEYKSWRTEAGYSLLAQRPEKVKGDVVLTMLFGPRIRNADVTNRIKAVEDLLVEMRVIEDDRFVVRCDVAWADNVKGCAVVVRAA
jgi:Holliday junction resolvase RusA-like endonuclease